MSSLSQRGRYKKAQAPPLPGMARDQKGDLRGLQKVGAKSENFEEGVEVAKEVLSRIHSVKANGNRVSNQSEKVGV